MKKIKRDFFCIIVLILLMMSVSVVQAAPPFITDDASPADFRQLQFYFFSNINVATHTTTLQLPALETNYGIIPNMELHLIVTNTGFFQQNGSNTIGLGDTEVGVKYRFLQDHGYCPAAAFAPIIELPTGDSGRNLGNGRTWFKLPVWLEKRWGPWDSYCGGGYVYNSAAHMNNFIYGGWQLQRDLTQNFTLGAEIFSQGAAADTQVPPFQDTGEVTLINLGASYALRSNLFIIGSVGHSILGTNQWVSYVALNYNINNLKLYH